jgi:hypothetical protein
MKSPDEEPVVPRRGRPRLHADAAAKQRAYRRRRALQIAAIGSRQPAAESGSGPSPDPADGKPATGKELLEALQRSGFIGAWKDRVDIGDSSEFARRLRERAQSRERD